jgi:hypothetical protein
MEDSPGSGGNVQIMNAALLKIALICGIGVV